MVSSTDYVELDGMKYLVGPYTFDLRQKYIAIQMELYLHRHPEAKRIKAKRVAMNKWRLVVNKSLEQGSGLLATDSKPSSGDSNAPSPGQIKQMEDI